MQFIQSLTEDKNGSTVRAEIYQKDGAGGYAVTIFVNQRELRDLDYPQTANISEVYSSVSSFIRELQILNG